MRLIHTTLIVLLLICGPGGQAARADGGQVRISKTQGDYRITVFTSPTPLRAGPVDISVMLQRTADGDVVPDADLTVELTHRNSPTTPIRAKATAAAATNKLLQAAVVELPRPGWWDVRVVGRDRSSNDEIRVEFAMQAGPVLPAWLSVWGWFGWPLLVVLMFGVHRLLVARHRRRTTICRSD